ncbi:MAG: alpha/beta hydrolase [Bifidobacteriaceae bacterium]|nr:alpha/beta hydrolase [Bifidobacteriaceae bacterium]
MVEPGLVVSEPGEESGLVVEPGMVGAPKLLAAVSESEPLGEAKAPGKTGEGAPEGNSEALVPLGEFTQLGELAAQIQGAGPPVVMLHGNSEDGRVFDRMVPRLSGFTTISLDSRGHGRSPYPVGRLTITGLAIDTCRALEDYRRRTGYRGRFGVIGFSDGANIGLEIALHRPDLLAAQVLMGGNTYPGALKPWTKTTILAGYCLMRFLAPFHAAVGRRAQVWGLMVGQPNVTRAQLESVTVPTLVMAGERDVVPRQESLRTARLIPGAEWVELIGHGHSLPRSAPALAGDLSREFLAAYLGLG